MIARVLDTPTAGGAQGRQPDVHRAGRRPSQRSAGVERRHREESVEPQFKKSPNWGPILATGGGLVFSGGTNDRLFRAFDATSGEVLWEYPTNSGVYAPPSSFMVDGQQDIAVVSGWGQDARSMESRINGVSLGHYPDVPEGGVIWVFAVK